MCVHCQVIWFIYFIETSKQCNENDSGADKTVSLNSGSQKEPLNRAFQNETTAENEESKKDTSSQNSATSLVDVNVSVTSVASGKIENRGT